MKSYEFDGRKYLFAPGFEPKEDFRIIQEKGAKIIAAYTSTFNGRELFSIRELYQEYGDWKPGKGLSVPASMKQELLGSIQTYARMAA